MKKEKTYYDFENGRIAFATEEDAEAKGMRELNLGDKFNAFSERDETEYQKMKKQVRQINASTDPRDTEEIKEYLRKQAEADYFDRVATLEQEYTAYRSELLEEAAKKKATFTATITPDERSTAEGFANRYALDLSTANEFEQKQALAQMADELGYLSDGARFALQRHLVELRPLLHDGAHGAFKDVTAALKRHQPFELYAPEALSTLPTRIASRSMIYRLVTENDDPSPVPRMKQ